MEIDLGWEPTDGNFVIMNLPTFLCYSHKALIVFDTQVAQSEPKSTEWSINEWSNGAPVFFLLSLIAKEMVH